MKIKQQCSMVRILLAASFILLSSFSEARITKIKQSLLFAPHHLGNVALLHSEEKGFWVVQKGQEHPVDDFLLDPQLQGLSSNGLDAFLRDGLISIIPHDSGEFELEACHSEAGKGPFTGAIAAWTVRIVAYGIVAKGAKGVIGSLNGLKITEAEKFLSFALTQTTGGGLADIAGASELVSRISPELATAAVRTEASITVVGGAIAASSAIEAVAYGFQAFFSALAFLP